MIVYQLMNDDPPTVSKHGSTFNEAEERQKQYPFQLCPECLSEHTEVVKRLNSDRSIYSYTEYKRWIRNGIFEYQCERVNYICKDCKCEFYQWYRTGEKQSVEVDGNVALSIIGAILTALSIFMFITSMSINDPTGWTLVVLCLSVISLATFGAMTLVAFTENLLIQHTLN